jgi:G3E family GTPase
LQGIKPVFLAKDGYVEEDIETLFGQVKTEPKRTSRHDAFKSHTLTLNGFYSKLEVEEFFQNLPKSIYRAKGIIHCL